MLTRFKAVCETVAYAHTKGILHRDLKPGNIMLGKFGETLVVDWGEAESFKIPNTPGPSATNTVETRPIEPLSSHTRTFGVRVTLPYVSPEQARDPGKLTSSSDIYSLGATLYTLITGQTPFQGPPTVDILEQLRVGTSPVPPRVLKPGVAKPLEKVCLKAMALDLSDRYASAGELADDVENYLAGRPVSAWPEPWTLRADRWASRHRTTVMSIATALLVAILVVGAVRLSARTYRLRVESEAEKCIKTADLLSNETKANPAKWSDMRVELERHKALLESTSVDGNTLHKVKAWLTFLQAQDRDRRMVRELDEARLEGAAINDRGYLDREATAEAYRSAFRAYGIDLDKLPTKNAVDLIQSSNIQAELLAGIDEWRNAVTDKPTRSKLFALPRMADEDPVRGKIRDTINRRDRPGLRSLVREIVVDQGQRTLTY